MVVRQGDRGDAVRQAQRLLNKMGSLLEEDGVFGSICVEAANACRTQLGLGETTGYDSALHAALEQQPDPLPTVDTYAVAMIAREEVGSRQMYESRCTTPIFPGGESGITIGVGYDLRFAATTFHTDWSDLLPAPSMDELSPWVGRQGSAQGARELRTVHIPWSAAWTVFTRRTLPRTLAQVQKAFPGQEALSPLARGAILSLIYNRGAAMEGDKRAEMRQIRDAIAHGRTEDVAPALLGMRRLWPTMPGLCRRRDSEAAMFIAGLV